jgi:hypothetical protein
MSKAIENLEAAQRQAIATRPKVGGFPYLAETLRRAGVTRNFWFLPACQSVYLTNDGPVVIQGKPLATGTMTPAEPASGNSRIQPRTIVRGQPATTARPWLIRSARGGWPNLVPSDQANTTTKIGLR